MKELGLTVKETAIIYTLLPITQTLSSPIAGLIADRLGKYRDVLLVSIVMSVLLATALLYVPTIIENSPSNSLNVSVPTLCDGSPLLIKNCDVSSINNSVNNILSISCQVKCDALSVNATSPIEIYVVYKSHNSSICEYNVSDIYTENTTWNLLCSSVPQISKPNCSIICNVSNITLDTSSSFSSGRLLTFYLYSVLRVVHNIFSAIGYTLVNSSALALTETDTQMGEYGRQRFVYFIYIMS